MITIHFVNFPDDIYGACRKTKHGFIIAINKGMTYEQTVKTIRHEMTHIRLNHFDSDRPLEEIENEADAYLF